MDGERFAVVKRGLANLESLPDIKRADYLDSVPTPEARTTNYEPRTTYYALMLLPITVVVAAAIGGFLAGYVLWWASHRGGLWTFAAAIVGGLAVFGAAILIAYIMVRSSSPF
jgi:hypothetical protein